MPRSRWSRGCASRSRGSFRPGGAGATCSIGVISCETAPDSVDELLAAADALMYEAKAAGKDRVRHGLLRVGAAPDTQGRLLPFSSASRTRPGALGGLLTVPSDSGTPATPGRPARPSRAT